MRHNLPSTVNRPCKGIAILLVTMTLGGCGGNAPDPAAAAAAPAAERSIFISAKDCRENSKITRDICEALIDQAIDAHVQSAANYASVKACEAVEGADRCEHVSAKAYRPRLLAFLVTQSNPPSAVPLYATGPDQADKGLRTADRKTTIVSSDDGYAFSRLATAAVEQ